MSLVVDNLYNIKVILGIDPKNDQSKDEILTILRQNIYRAMRSYIGATSLPSQLEWILDEATVRRYNLLGSEHLKSENIDVISSTYVENVLDAYMPFIDAYLEREAEREAERLSTPPPPPPPNRLRML